MFQNSHKTLHRTLAIAAAVVLMSMAVSAASYGPVGFPKTLLSLFQESDVIAVAKFAKTEHGRAVREDSEFAILKTKRLFDVSYVLKGEHSKFFAVEDEEFVSKYAPAPTVPEELIDDEFHITAGDTVLIFIRKGDDGKTLEFVNADDSVKKLNSRDLAVYESRIAELRSLYENGQPEPSRLLEWLIACTQDTATRWEGAFEMITSFERAEYQAKQPAIELKNVSVAPQFDRAVFARILTEEQRMQLANILLTPSPSAKNPAVRGDNELMELIAKWGDPRLPAYLVEQIKNDPKPSYRLTVKVRTLLKLLGDKRAEQLASKINEAVAVNEAEEAGKTKQDAVLKFVNYAESRITPQDK
jgi:hypothetical protein